MAASSQVPAQSLAPSRRTERVLKVPPVSISIATADKAIELVSTVARELVYQELEQRMRSAYRQNPADAAKLDPDANGEDDFIRRNIGNAEMRRVAQLPTHEKYVFLSPTANVLFDSAEFRVEDLPWDLDLLTARADGVNGRFIDIHLQTKFQDFNQARNWQLNQIIIQGDDVNWVNGTYERLRTLLSGERRAVRGFLYGNVLKLFWTSAVLLLFAEYRLAHWLYPSFSLSQPLTGTGALLMFGVLAGSLIAFGEFFIPALTYWFPYFEIEKNISQSRLASRKFVTGVLSAIYTGAVLNAFQLVFGPVLKRWLGL